MNSVSVNPFFVSATDLHTAVAALDNSGIYIPGIFTDLDGNPITNPPDMGCYQFEPAPSVVTEAATDVTSNTATLNAAGDPSGYSVNIFFDYGSSTAYGNTVSGVPSVISGTSTYTISAPLTGLAGNTTCHFRVRGVYDGTKTVYGHDTVFRTARGVPSSIALTGVITNDTCFNATDTITVAGTPKTFLVMPSGHVTMIAAMYIRFLPGSTVKPGGYLHGYITANNQFCTSSLNPVVSSPVQLAGMSDSPSAVTSDPGVRISPNPAEGLCTIELMGNSGSGITSIEIFSMSGLRVMTQKRSGERRTSISVSGLQPGMYIINVVTGSKNSFLKLIRM